MVHVCVKSTDKSQHRLSMWQHVLGACIKHSHEMEGEHDATARQWWNGREERRHSHALHRNEWKEGCMRHGVKWKEKHRRQHSCHRLSDKIRKERKMTKSIRIMLGVLSCNRLVVNYWLYCQHMEAFCHIPNSTWIPKVLPSRSWVISVWSPSYPRVLPSTLKYSRVSQVKPEPVHLPPYTWIICIPPSLAPSLLQDFGIPALYYSLYTLYTWN